MNDPTASARARAYVRRDWYVLLFAAGVFVVCLVSQRPGHDWGDDFALYLNQSRALVEGNIADVLSATRYTLQESTGSTFSPLSYPWGAPLLFAPVIAVWGLDFALLKTLVAVFFVAFLLLLHALVARRAGRVGGFAVTALIGLSVPYLGWTDTVLAEFPFLFFLVLSIWWLDRCGDRRAWDTGPLWPLVVSGLLIAFTFNIRREGLALLPALVVAQLVYLRERGRMAGSGPVPWRRLGVPHATFIGFVAGFHVMFPTVLFQRYPETGLHNLVPNVQWFRDVLAQHLGLTRPGWEQWELFGSYTVALVLFTVFLTLAFLGMLVRSLNHGRHDGPLIAYLFGATLIVGVLPFHEGRYMFAITPWLGYFAYQGVATTIRDVLLPTASKVTRAVPIALAAALMATLVSGSAVWLVDRTAQRLETRGEVVWGPEHPASQEMFEAVRSHTRRDDIVSFFRARAMTLYSERQALQLARIDHILARADWYVMEKDSTYSQVLLTTDQAVGHGLALVWENDRFVLWRVPGR
jgi:hypothetical protein